MPSIKKISSRLTSISMHSFKHVHVQVVSYCSCWCDSARLANETRAALQWSTRAPAVSHERNQRIRCESASHGHIAYYSLCNHCLRASLPEALDLQVCPISESPAGSSIIRRLQYIPDLATVDPGTFSAVYQASLDAARCSDVPLSMILSYRRPRGYLFFLSNLITELCPKPKTAWLAAWILA